MGAVGGAIALAVIGFAWGGWVTGANARDASEKNADSAVVSVLAPICAVQFRTDQNATEKLVELNGLSSYKQPKFIEEGGWAVMPGAETAVDGVANGCAKILTADT